MKNYSILLLFFGLVPFFSLQSQDLNQPWEVPESYIEMPNPFEADKSSIKKGKTVYENSCITCHGKKGAGDGSMARMLSENPSDFTLDDIDVQKDGELFYKIMIGRGEMHSHVDKLKDEEVWNVINYIRTFYK
jgi:mono/diheme cytochrome c family protein